MSKVIPFCKPEDWINATNEAALRDHHPQRSYILGAVRMALGAGVVACSKDDGVTWTQASLTAKANNAALTIGKPA